MFVWISVPCIQTVHSDVFIVHVTSIPVLWCLCYISILLYTSFVSSTMMCYNLYVLWYYHPQWRVYNLYILWFIIHNDVFTICMFFDVTIHIDVYCLFTVTINRDVFTLCTLPLPYLYIIDIIMFLNILPRILTRHFWCLLLIQDKWVCCNVVHAALGGTQCIATSSGSSQLGFSFWLFLDTSEVPLCIPCADFFSGTFWSCCVSYWNVPCTCYHANARSVCPTI